MPSLAPLTGAIIVPGQASPDAVRPTVGRTAHRTPAYGLLEQLGRGDDRLDDAVPEQDDDEQPGQCEPHANPPPACRLVQSVTAEPPWARPPGPRRRGRRQARPGCRSV